MATHSTIGHIGHIDLINHIDHIDLIDLINHIDHIKPQYQLILREKYITTARMKNRPMLPNSKA